MFPRLIKGASATPKPFKIDPNKVLAPRSFRAEGPRVYPPPEEVFDYRPPSLLRRHGILALVFVLACCALVGYLVRLWHAPLPAPAHAPAGSAGGPVYVEPLGPAGAPH